MAKVEFLPPGYRVLPPEDMALTGTVEKNYVAYGDHLNPDHDGYIAKKPKGSAALDCVVEEMIASIGRMLPLAVADSKLARLKVPTGAPADIRFLSKNFIRRGEEQLVHGVELLAAFLSSDPDELEEVLELGDRKRESRYYTLETCLLILKQRARTDAERERLVDGFGRMLAFDALVGSQDRHGNNWGTVESPRNELAPIRFSPIFDTARGLFYDHREPQLEQIERSGRRSAFIERYALRSQPPFGCGQPEGRKVTHFELIEHALIELRADLQQPICAVVREFRMTDVERMLRRRFTRLITKLRMNFVLDLLDFRVRYLKRLLESVL